MKFRSILFAASIVVLSAACQDQIENPVEKSNISNVKLIPVTFTAGEEESKTTLGENNSIVWEEGDKINVLDNSELCEAYDSFEATGAGTSTGFTGEIGEDATTFFALYPYDENAQSSWMLDNECAMFSTTLAKNQYARLAGLPANTNIAIAKADNNKSFAFHNVCGLVKFTLERDDIAAITIAPNGDNALALAGGINLTIDSDGSVTDIERTETSDNAITVYAEDENPFTPGTYYVCALPGVYTGGITVTFMNSDTELAEISSDATLTITAGKIRNLGTIDANISFGSDDEEAHTIVCETDCQTENDILTLNNNEWGYTIVTAKNEGSNPPSYVATGKDVRVYAKGSITISNSKPITKIVFNISEQGLKRLAPIFASVGTIKTQQSGDTTVEWTGKANSIIFTVGDNADYGSDGSSKAGQLDFLSIDATYLVSPMVSIAVSGTLSKTEYYEDEEFDLTGLTAIATYADGTTLDVTASAEWTVSPSPLTAGTTSVSVTAKFGEMTSDAYIVDNISVLAIPEKTIAQFIASEGGKCYITGIVSNIANTTYGNFDLTDESGTIYVYGCLTPEGEAKKFSTLDVVNGDKIKVLADEYEYYNSSTHEAKNVVFVEEIEIVKTESVLTIGSPEYGTISVKDGDNVLSSGAQVEEGTILTLVSTPASNCRFVSWSVIGADETVISVSNNKFTMPAQAVTVSAVFEQIPSHSITYNIGENGTVSGPSSAYEGETVTLTVTPESGYQLATLTVNGQNIKTAMSFVMPDTDVSISATFEEEHPVLADGDYVILAERSGTYYALSVQPNGSSQRRDRVAVSFNGGDSFTTSAADLIWTFTASNGIYLISNGTNFMGSARNTIPMKSESDAADVTIVDNGDGTYTLSADCGSDGIRYLAMNDANGFAWYASGTGVSKLYLVPVAPPTQYNITVNTASNGSVSANKSQAAAGETVTLSNTPASGYELDEYTVVDASGNHVSVTNGTFEMPASNVTVSATFKESSGSGEVHTFTIKSDDVVTNSSYNKYETTVDGRDWFITFGGNNKSVGTNSSNRPKCNLSNYSKYAVSPITTSDVASAFASKTKLNGVTKISYTFNGGSNQASTNVYLLYSSDNNTFSQISLTSGTQGATISSGTEFAFSKCDGYFALLFVATNSSGNWRIDDVNLTFTYSN